MCISPPSEKMESGNVTDPYEDNRDVDDESRRSLRSTRKDSRESSFRKQEKNFLEKDQSEVEKDDCPERRSKTRTWPSDPDRDRMSGGEGRRSRSCYSEDYENESLSEGSLSPYSQSRTPSPSPRRGPRTKRVSSPLYRTGVVGRRIMSYPVRPGGQQQRKVGRSQSKETTPPKEMDLVTKKVLSNRLLRINELRNALAELEQRTVELQKENRILRQLQVRQDKALQRYDDTESEISQLLARHSNETHVLRERLRRTQERERAAERRLKDGEEQLQRSQATVKKLKRLVDQEDLGTRDELSRRLEEEKTRAQEAEQRIKELERCMELSSSSFQRQLASERKKTISAQEDIRTLQEDLERLTNKLKEKEKELDTRNIYANRMTKCSLRKDTDSVSKRTVPSRNSTKTVQTRDRPSSMDFPTPPPALTEGNEDSEQAPNGYLSLKQDAERQPVPEDRHPKSDQPKTRDTEKDGDKEKVLVKEKEEKEERQKPNREPEEKAKKARHGLEKEPEKVEDRKETSSPSKHEEEDNRKQGHVQEEVHRLNKDALANRQASEEAQRKKDQLLAKMREIDRLNQGVRDEESSPPPESSRGERRSPHPPVQRNHSASIFHLTESEESPASSTNANAPAQANAVSSGRRRSFGLSRRTLHVQSSDEDLAFGGYAPSFGSSSSRGFPPPPTEDRDSALEAIGVFSLRGKEKEKDMEREAGKDKKSSLMQQLFGALATPVTPAGDGSFSFNKMEVLNSPATTNGVRSRRDGLLGGFRSGSTTPPASTVNTMHITDSRPAIRAMPSFDDDIETLTL